MDELDRASENPYAQLPERIRPEDMITEQATREPGDPSFDGRDTNMIWLVKYA
jgi:hypothetical protein